MLVHHILAVSGLLHGVEEARSFVICKLSSDNMIHKINNLERKHPWIDDGYVDFELVGNASHLFLDILSISSKVYRIRTGPSFLTNPLAPTSQYEVGANI